MRLGSVLRGIIALLGREATMLMPEDGATGLRRVKRDEGVRCTKSRFSACAIQWRGRFLEQRRN